MAKIRAIKNQHNLFLLFFLCGVGALIVLRAYIADVSQWREDSATLFYHAGNIWQEFRVPEFGLINSLGLHNMPGLEWAALPFTLMPDAWWTTLALSLAQVLAISVFVLGMGELGYLKFFIVLAIVSHPSISFSGIEAFPLLQIPLLVIAYALAMMRSPRWRLMGLLAAVFFALMITALYWGMLPVSFAAVLFIGGMLFSRRRELNSKYLTYSFAACACAFAIFYLSFLLYEYKHSWVDVLGLLKNNSYIIPQSLPTATAPIHHSFLATAAALPMIMFNYFNSAIGVPVLSTMYAYDPGVLTEKTRGLVDVFRVLSLTLFAAAFISGVILVARYVFKTAKATLVGGKTIEQPQGNLSGTLFLQSVCFLFSALIIMYFISPSFFSRLDVIPHYLPLILVVMLALPVILVREMVSFDTGKHVLKAALAIFLALYAIGNSLVVYRMAKDHLQYPGPHVSSVDLPLRDKLAVVKWIAQVAGDAGPVTVDYDFSTAPRWSWIPFFTRLWDEYSIGRLFDWQLRRGYGIINANPDKINRNCMCSRFYVTYAHQIVPNESLYRSNKVFGRLRVLEGEDRTDLYRELTASYAASGKALSFPGASDKERRVLTCLNDGIFGIASTWIPEKKQKIFLDLDQFREIERNLFGRDLFAQDHARVPSSFRIALSQDNECRKEFSGVTNSAVSEKTPPSSMADDWVAYLKDGDFGIGGTWISKINRKILLDLKQAREIGSVSFSRDFFDQSNDHVDRLPTSFRISLSPDNKSWKEFPRMKGRWDPGMVEYLVGRRNARYIRLEIFDTNDGLEPAIDEIIVRNKPFDAEMRERFGISHVYIDQPVDVIAENTAYAPPPFAGDIALAGTASASSVISGYVKHTVRGLNDGIFGNGYSWIPATAGREWVQVDLGAAAEIRSVSLSRDFYRRYADRLPLEFNIMISMDGENWRSFHIVRQSPNPGLVEYLVGEQKGRYVKIEVLRTSDNTPPCIDEVIVRSSPFGEELATHFKIERFEATGAGVLVSP